MRDWSGPPIVTFPQHWLLVSFVFCFIISSQTWIRSCFYTFLREERMGFPKIYSFLFEIDFFRSYNRYRRVIIHKALEPLKSVILGLHRIWFVTGKIILSFPFFCSLFILCYKTFQAKNHFYRGTWHHFYNFLNFFCQKSEHCVNLLEFCCISLGCNTF